MKKNRMMRLASILLVCVLLTTSVISGTFAKYTTSVTSNDRARVAKWGFNVATINFENLFAESYTHVVDGTEELAIIAPGTAGNVTFAFENAGKPEVAYKITVDTNGSDIHSNIENNPNILWALDDENSYGTWDDMLTAIADLSQAEVAAGELPDNFGEDETHTIYWKWIFDQTANNKEADTVNQDVMDTNMGNGAVGTEQSVTLVINILAEQLD